MNKPTPYYHQLTFDISIIPLEGSSSSVDVSDSTLFNNGKAELPYKFGFYVKSSELDIEVLDNGLSEAIKMDDLTVEPPAMPDNCFYTKDTERTNQAYPNLITKDLSSWTPSYQGENKYIFDYIVTSNIPLEADENTVVNLMSWVKIKVSDPSDDSEEPYTDTFYLYSDMLAYYSLGDVSESLYACTEVSQLTIEGKPKIDFNYVKSNPTSQDKRFDNINIIEYLAFYDTSKDYKYVDNSSKVEVTYSDTYLKYDEIPAIIPSNFVQTLYRGRLFAINSISRHLLHIDGEKSGSVTCELHDTNARYDYNCVDPDTVFSSSFFYLKDSGIENWVIKEYESRYKGNVTFVFNDTFGDKLTVEIQYTFIIINGYMYTDEIVLTIMSQTYN